MVRMCCRTAVTGVLLFSLGGAPLGAWQAVEPPPIPAGRAAPAGAYGDVDVLAYRAVIGLPGDGGSSIDGEATLTLRPTRGGIQQAVLDFTGLAVSAVTVDGARVEASYREGRLGIPLPPGAGPADTVVVVVSYEGVPDDGLILGDNVHRRPSAFVDNWPNRTRFWLPSVDHPSDKATFDLTVLAPAAWSVVGNGILAAPPEAAPPAPDGTPRRAWRWRTEVAVSSYNLVFGAAELEVVPLGLAACGRAPASPREDGCVEVSAWLFAEDVGQARTSFARAAEMVDFYSDLIGPYPFEKLAHVQSATRFGGMENASAIFYDQGGLASGRSIEGTVAHETAHQWFGDSATEVDWPELWLSEGFATYFGHLYFEHVDGKPALRRLMDQDRRRIVASADVRRPVIDRDEQDLFALLNVNNYPKGGWVLHMLRGIVGKDAFFQGIRGYYGTHAGGNATTGDLRRAMEAASGRDLAWFFRQWLEEPGYPVLDASSAWDGVTGETVVTVRQLQEAGWPVFRLPLVVEVEDAQGVRARKTVEITAREESFRVPGGGEGARVSLDPDGWVLFGAGR